MFTIDLCKTNKNAKETTVIARRAKPDEAIPQRLLRFLPACRQAGARNDKTFPIAYAKLNIENRKTNGTRITTNEKPNYHELFVEIR